MSREIAIENGELVVRLRGCAAAAALKRELRAPLSAIRSVTGGTPDHLGVRVGGTELPFRDVRAGRFWRRGVRTFVSIEDRARAVTIELEGQPYDRLVLGTDEPDALRAALIPPQA